MPAIASWIHDDAARMQLWCGGGSECTPFRRGYAVLVASGVFVLGLVYAAGVTHAAPVANEVMLVNAKTGKCLTIAGGVSTGNNVDAVQFNCDNDLSRQWTIRLKL